MMKYKDFNLLDAQISLVSRLVDGPGEASNGLRRAAFENSGLDDPLRTLVDKVANAPTKISDSDFSAALDAGYTEDQLFELVVCAAVGDAARDYQIALAALDKATTTEDTDHATRGS